MPKTELRKEPVRLAVLTELIGDEPDAMREILAVYLHSSRETADELRHAITAGDTAKLEAAAHRLKSPSLAIGADDLGKTCALLEAAAHAGRLEEVRTLARSFEAAYADVVTYLAEYSG